jgi:nitrous oxide reductase accessory protein NosL
LGINASTSALLSKKGAKIAKVYCDQKALQKATFHNLKEAQNRIVSEKICEKLTPQQLKAVAAYALSQTKSDLPDHIAVPKEAKCPICGMFVAKYPKWTAYVKDTKGKEFYFDGVKDMMKYYFNHKNEHFSPILVQDFYTLKPIDGRKAFYVIGSNVYGPMGEELIPFQKLEDAKIFKKEHFGKRIITFDEIQEDYLY